MKFQSINVFNLAALIAFALGSSAANAAVRSKWCELVLTQEAYETYVQYVENAVARRTEPLKKEAKAELRADSGPNVDILEGINRELAQPILEQSRAQSVEFFKSVAEQWMGALREDIIARAATLKERKQKPGFDSDGLPLVPIVQNNRELALKIRASKQNIGASDIEIEVANARVAQVRDEFMAEASEVASRIIEQQVEALAASLNRVSPDWEAVRVAMAPIFARYVERLNEAYPFTNPLSRGPLARAWVEAVAKSWNSSYASFIHNKANADTRREALSKVELDADGLPKVAVVQNNRELALKFAKGGKKKLDAADIVAAVQLELARAEIKAASDEYVRRVSEMSARLEEAGSWAEARAVLEPVVAQMSQRLSRAEALKGAEPSRVSSAYDRVEALTQASSSVMPVVPRARLNENGVPEVVIDALGVRAYYDVELGTVVLESSKGTFAKKEGMLVALDHGDGTTQSNASSWKYILPKLIGGNLNVVAINLPMAGIGMPLKGLHQTIEYLDRRFTVLRNRADEAGFGLMPLVHIGRSMGAQKGLAHALLRDGQGNVVDMYVEMSISNPYTIAEQVVLVMEQVKNGTIKGVVKDALDNASEISAELREVVAEIKRKDPTAFRLVGEGVIALQGRGDRDGGKTVVEDLLALRDEVAPMMLVYEFQDPLAGYKIPGLEKIGDESLESMHNLFSNYANMSVEQAARLFPNVKPEDRPMVADQHFEAVAVIYGMGDFLAASRSPTPAMQRRAAKWRAYREALAGEKTLLDWYREDNGISKEEFERAEPGRSSRAARLKRVQEFFEKAQRDHSAIYSQ